MLPLHSCNSWSLGSCCCESCHKQGPRSHVVRSTIPSEANGGLAALIKADAKIRLFTPEQIESFIEHNRLHAEFMAGKILTADAEARVAADLGNVPHFGQDVEI